MKKILLTFAIIALALCGPVLAEETPNITSTILTANTVSLADLSATYDIDADSELGFVAEATGIIYMAAQGGKRLVRVFLVDPDENVPLKASVLYESEEKYTDQTDRELWFELPIMELLKAHNKRRIQMTDKDASKKYGREIFLEPAKIRDLKMVVTEIARF